MDLRDLIHLLVDQAVDFDTTRIRAKFEKDGRTIESFARNARGVLKALADEAKSAYDAGDSVNFGRLTMRIRDFSRGLSEVGTAYYLQVLEFKRYSFPRDTFRFLGDALSGRLRDPFKEEKEMARAFG